MSGPMIRRLHGATLGLGLGSLAPALALLWLVREDPGFADHLPSLLLFVFLPVQLLGVLLGGLLAPQGRAVLGVGLVCLAAAALSVGESTGARVRPPPVESALLVLAFPSVSWEEVEQGAMPGVQALATRGARIRLPAMEGGLDDWITLDSGISTRGRPWSGERPTADRVSVARIWDIAAYNGLSLGLMGWPVTAPARPPTSGGFVIPPGLAPSAWPEAAQAMPDAVRALLAPDAVSAAPIPAALDLLPLGLRWSTLRDAGRYVLQRRLSPEDRARLADRPLVRARLERDVFLAMMHREQPALAAMVLSGPPASQGRARGRALEQADGFLAEILAALTESTTVVLLSDRGWMLAAGPRIASGTDPGPGALEDVAPTLLGLLELPAAEDQRGRQLLGGPPRRLDTWDALAPSPPEHEARRAAAAEALRALSYWE